MVITREDRNLKAVESLFLTGGVVVCPAFTIYGLSANLFNISANKRIYRIKRRDYSKPLIVIATKNFVLKTAIDIDREILSFLLDNTITVIVKSSATLPFYATANSEVAFRVANTPFLNHICRNSPITSTSANFSGDQSVFIDSKIIFKRFAKLTDGFVFGKVIGEPSTIVRLAGKSVEIVRKGYNIQKIKEVL